MIEINVEDYELVKVNGETYYKCPEGTLTPVTSVTRSIIASDLIERACEIDMNLGNGKKNILEKNRTMYSYKTNRTYSIKYFRNINNPSNFGLPVKGDCKYLLYWDFNNKDEEILIFEYQNGKLVNIIEDYKEKLLDGEYIS